VTGGKRIALATAITAAIAGGMGPAAGARPIDLGAQLRALVRMPGGPPGAIALVQRGRRLTVYRAGVSSVRSRAPMRPNDRMRLASTAKAYSGAVALALVNRGLLSLNSTIGQLLPALPAAWGQVTLGQALAHTSGLPDYSGAEGLQKYLPGHLHAQPSPSFLLSFITSRQLNFRPGSRYVYSNTDNIVAALMAQAATGRSYDQLLARYVYEPLGAKRTSLPSGPGLARPYIHGYAVDPGKRPEDVSTLVSAAYAWASGGVVSTPAEMNRFIRAYVGARLFSRATQRGQFRFRSGHSDPIGPGTNADGLAVFRYRTRCGTVYGHTGNIFGYTQLMAATPDGRRSVTVSINAQITQDSKGKVLAAFRRLRDIEGDAVCLALR
jgi:D-alanyl-D-alanine carboxypeptidase